MSTVAATPPVSFDDSKTHTSLWNVIRSEWTKVWSVRSTTWTLISLVVVTIGLSTLIAWGDTSSLNNPRRPPGPIDPTNTSMAGLAFGQLAIAVLGVLIITSEYSSRGIKTTLIAVPNRLRVLVAKGIVFAVLAWVVGTVAAFGAFFVSMIFYRHYHIEAHLGDPGVLRAVLGGGLLALASGMVGFALGVLIRHTAGAITAAVAVLFVLPPLSNLLPGTWGDWITKRFTTNAGQAITEVLPQSQHLSPWAGYFTMTVQWVVPLLIGAYLMKRRDA